MDQYRRSFAEPSSRKPVWCWPNELPIEGEPADVVQVVETYNQWLRQSDLAKLLFYAALGVLVPAPVVDWCKEHLKNLRTVDV